MDFKAKLNEVHPKAAPTSIPLHSDDGQGHYWLLQQGTEFWAVGLKETPNLTVQPGEKKIQVRGAAVRGGILDKLAERMIRLEHLTPRPKSA